MEKLYEEIKRDSKCDPFKGLMKLPIQPVMEHIDRMNEEKNNIFGFLPLMCKASPCQLGALNAQSFAERIISVGNLIITKKRTKLDDNLLKQLIVLRMNRGFMEFARHNKIASSTHIRGIADETADSVKAMI